MTIETPPLKLQITLWLIAGLTMLSGTVISASLPGISSHFLSNDSALDNILSRLILTIPALTIAIVAPIAGVIIQKVGRLKPLYFGLVVYALAGCTGLFADSIWTILAGRIGLGLAVAFILTVSTTLTGDYIQGEFQRQRFMAIQGSFITFAGAVFLAGGGFLCEINWRIPFGIYFVSLLMIPLVVSAFYEPEPVAKSADGSDSGYAGPGGYLTTMPVFVAAFLTMVIFFVVPTQLPFLVQHMGGSGSDAGLVMGVGPIVAGVVSFYYAKIRRVLSVRQVFAMVCLMQGVGLAAVGFADQIWQLYLPFIFVGIGNGLSMANTNVWFLQLAAPAKRAKLSGLLTGSLFLGQFCSPLFIQPLLHVMELHMVFTFYGVILLVVAVLIFLIKTRFFPER
jgi:MFS family permease